MPTRSRSGLLGAQSLCIPCMNTFYSTAVILFITTCALISCVDARRWSYKELTTLAFPYETSNDANMDICKQGGYMLDIALTPADVIYMKSVNRTVHKIERVIRRNKHTHNHHRQRRIANAKAHLRLLESKLAGRTKSGGRGRNRRAATGRAERIWDHGVIPYEIQANFTGEHKALFQKAMRHWENFTCISFVERTPEDENYIVFTIAECGCCSFVGKRGGGPQAISIGKNCDKFGIVVHELGHVIGFWHEHTRPDRDQFVDIFYKNIEKVVVNRVYGSGTNIWKNTSEGGLLSSKFGLEKSTKTTPKSKFVTKTISEFEEDGSGHGDMVVDNDNPNNYHIDNDIIFEGSGEEEQDYNFEKLKPDDVNSLGEAYDFASIMHYARDTFARQQYMDTILPKPDAHTAHRPEIGQRIRLSPGDIRQANKLYKCPECGRTLIKATDVLSMGNQQRQPQCHWRIIATQGERIRLNITALQLPISPDCHQEKHNYLQVRDGHYPKSRLIAKFCGPISRPEVLLSSGNRLWIELKNMDMPKANIKSVYTKEEDVFAASYKVVCGGEVIGEEGILQSPDYPEDYRSDQNCIWKITMPPDYQVALKFQMFQLENHNDCIYDRLEIFDGHADDAPLIGKFCGYSLPANVKSTSNKMKIRFYSDNSVEKAGFALQYFKEFDECLTSNHGCQHKCVNTLGGYKCECDIGYELHTDGKNCEDACGGYIKAEKGTLQSPNFPSVYPSNKKCIWEIEAHPQYRITVNFTHFDLEGMENNCEYDSVQVVSIGADSTETRHGNFCGHMKNLRAITSETNRLRVEFKSDSSVQKSGFAAVFFTDKDECDVDNGGCQQVCRNIIGSYVCECQSGYVLAEDGFHCKEGGCKHELNAASGRITSPNYPHEYPNKKECVWHFVTTPGHRLKLQFSEFEVEPHQVCEYDNVELFDGSTTSSRSLGRYCNPKVPEPILSSKNELFMIFTTDASVSRKGFVATFDSICGGTLVADESVGYIYSHAKYGGSNYDSKMECDWTIQAKYPNKAVQLRFTQFDVEEEVNCDYDWVKIFDGEGDDAPSFGQFCGYTPPEMSVSSSRSIRLRFHSDDTMQQKGFVAEYKMTAPAQAPPRTTAAPSTHVKRPIEPVVNEKRTSWS